jgi:ketosteroid isomerase-like protein
MGQRTNQADIAAVTEIVRTYYDRMVAGDQAKLARAFHPRACIVGSEQGAVRLDRPNSTGAQLTSAAPHERRAPDRSSSLMM